MPEYARAENLSNISSSMAVLQFDWRDAVEPKQGWSNLIECCNIVDKIFLNLWVLGKVVSLFKSKGSNPSDVIDEFLIDFKA